MPLPQRNARPRPAFHGNSLPSSGSVSPASAPSSLNLKMGVQGVSIATARTIRPGFLVPRKTTYDFTSTSIGENGRQCEARIVMDHEGDEESIKIHPGPDDEVEDKVVPRRPVGLGELIAAHQGRGRPPRGPIAHRMGFDIIPNPSHRVLIPEPDFEQTKPGSLSPSSVPGLSRSGGTASTVSPREDHFPVLPLSKIASPEQQHDDEADDDMDETDEWDMVHPDPNPDAWVGIETGHQQGRSGGDEDDSEDELIFLDEESLTAMRRADEAKKRQASGKHGVGIKGGRVADGLDYAAVLKA